MATHLIISSSLEEIKRIPNTEFIKLLIYISKMHYLKYITDICHLEKIISRLPCESIIVEHLIYPLKRQGVQET